MWASTRSCSADGTGHDRPETGSALLLVPAGVLVVIVLASLALDAAIVFAAQRQLADAASAAANDAVTVALDDAAFYGCGALRLDADRARQAALVSLSARTADMADPRPQVTTGADGDGRPTVTVRVDAHVDTIFRPALGAAAQQAVSASATAIAQQTVPATASGCDG